MKLKYSLLMAAMFAASANVSAAEGDEAAESPWKSSAELGYISTTGNTVTTTMTAKFDATYEVDKWRHNVNGEAFGQESEDNTGNKVTSAERYQLSGQSDYKFNEYDYAFGLVKLQKDRFSGFEYEDSISLGYGRKAIKQDNMELDLEIGPGARFFKLDNGSAEDEATLRLAGKYWWDITGNSKFTQDLIFDIGESYTTSESVTGISANINSTLALKFTYTLRHKDTVPAGTENLDTETAVTLVYTF